MSEVMPIEFTGKSQKEKVKEITDKLEQGIKDLFNSDRYKEYLSAMSKFHNYSFPKYNIDFNAEAGRFVHSRF